MYQNQRMARGPGIPAKPLHVNGLGVAKAAPVKTKAAAGVAVRQINLWVS